MPKYLVIVGIIAAILLVGYYKFYQTPVVFKGTTPCADCPGIEETITLNRNMTYSDQNVYLERDTSFTDTGKWSMIKGTKANPNAVVYQLDSKDGKKSYFLLDGNQIRPLDADLNELPAPYNAALTKQQ